MQKFNNETEFIFSNEFIGFTTIPNFILEDRTVSYKAVGIYVQILQYRNSHEHKIYIKSLVALKKDGRDSVSAGIKELIEAGYITREQIRNEKGQAAGIRYTVYMKPVKSTLSADDGKSVVGNADISKPVTYKENKAKKKITKNENITTTHQDQEKEKQKDSKESVVVDSTNSNLIESETNLRLTPYQTKTVSRWSKEKLDRSIEIYNTLEGQTFALLLKIYRGGAVNNLSNITMAKTKAVSNKVAAFNDLGENNREWDFDKLEALEEEHLKNELGNHSNREV